MRIKLTNLRTFKSSTTCNGERGVNSDVNSDEAKRNDFSYIFTLIGFHLLRSEMKYLLELEQSKHKGMKVKQGIIPLPCLSLRWPDTPIFRN